MEVNKTLKRNALKQRELWAKKLSEDILSEVQQCMAEGKTEWRFTRLKVDRTFPPPVRFCRLMNGGSGSLAVTQPALGLVMKQGLKVHINPTYVVITWEAF